MGDDCSATQCPHEDIPPTNEARIGGTKPKSTYTRPGEGDSNPRLESVYAVFYNDS